jgi:hypothetical protein
MRFFFPDNRRAHTAAVTFQAHHFAISPTHDPRALEVTVGSDPTLAIEIADTFGGRLHVPRTDALRPGNPSLVCQVCGQGLDFHKGCD